MGQVINAQSLFNRVRMWLSGVQFQGQRDLYQSFGWKRAPGYQDYVAAYYRQGIARRIIDAPVLGTWTNPPQLQVDNVEFADAWNEVCQTQILFNKIMRLDKLAGLGKYAVMVCGFDDGGKLNTAIKPGNKPRKVLYLQPYHEGAIYIKQYETNTSSPRFGKPVMYEIRPQRFNVEGVTTVPAMGTNVSETRQPFECHYTRLIHIAENLLEDGVFGTSRLEVVFNDICDVLKVSGASAESFWLLINRGMQVDVDKDMELSPEDQKALSEEVEDYQHHLRRFIRTRGVKVNNLGSDPVNPDQVFKMLVQLISMGTGIPQLILLGASIGQVSSRNDRANWADRLAERIAEYAEPIVLKAVLDCFINAGVLPAPVNMELSWPEAFKMDPLERAQTSAQMARSAVNLTRAAVHAAPVNANGQPITEGALFSNDEMRRMVSFGKHPPIFDSPQPTGDVPTAGSPEAQPSTTSDAGADPPPTTKPQVPGPAKTRAKPLGVKA